MNIRCILKQYSRIIGIPVKELTGRNRKQDTCIARQCFCKVMHERGMPARQMSAMFNLHWLTIKEGIRHVNDLLSVGDKYTIYCMETCRKLFNENNRHVDI